MEEIVFENDINLIVITAPSFPDGIPHAHGALHKIVPFSVGRRYFGISRPETGGAIVYRAGAEELAAGEAEKFKCDTMVIKKGKYAAITLEHYRNDPSAIGKIFQQLLRHPGLDPDGYCLEWYINDQDVKCMVPITGFTH